MFTYPFVSAQISKEDINNAPEAIRSKLTLLRQQERRITYLKYHLNILEDQHRLLKKELAPYLAPERRPSQNSGTTQVNFLDRLPDEILYIIFREYLKEEHHNIRRLLLVCRRWNCLVMGQAALWAKIQINWSHRAFKYSQLYSPIAYITACVERSHPLLLEIDLNIQNFQSSEEFLRKEIVDTIITLIEDPQGFNIDNEVETWDIRWHSPLYELSVERLFDCLVGANGEHMARWSSFTLYAFGERLAIENIWFRFKGAVPNLKTFKSNGFPTHADKNIELFQKGFRDLSSVTNLIILYGPPVSSYPISHTTLQQLSATFYNLGDLLPLSSYSQLRTLKLCQPHEEFSKWDKTSFAIYLPLLQTLELSGNGSLFSRMTFDLPKLDKLTILSHITFAKLPKLSPKSISWDISAYIVGNIAEIFQSILSLSSNLERITMSVSPEFRSRILTEIERCRANGSLLRSPHVIIFTPEYFEEQEISKMVIQEDGSFSTRRWGWYSTREAGNLSDEYGSVDDLLDISCLDGNSLSSD